MATISQAAFAKLLALNAVGLQRSGTRIFHATRAPWCDNPVSRHLLARKSMRQGLPAENGYPFHLDVWVPCRKCEKCRAYRAMDWRARIAMETKAHPKNWFCTLTFRPASRTRLFMEEVNGVPTLRSASSRHTRAMAEITLWIKRLRAALSASDASAMLVRFFAVTEEHKDGTPHIHVLIHCGDELKKSVITAAKWPHGFWSAKLVDEEASSYLTKYITKEHHRVRASLHYGYADSQKSGQVTKTPEGNSEGKQSRPFDTAHSSTEDGSFAGAEVVPTPEAMLKAMVYNGELRVDDGVSLLSTLIDLRSEQDGGTTVPTRPERARKGDKRLGEKAPARRSERGATEPVTDRPPEGGQDSRLRSRSNKKPKPSDGQT